MSNPTRSAVKAQVCAVLAVTSENFGFSKSASQIAANESWSLRAHLGIPNGIRPYLSTPYTHISEQYPNGIRVYRGEANNATTVRAAINLVWERSKGNR